MDPFYVNILYGLSLAFALLLLLAAIYDVTSLVIPNAIVVGVIALFCVAAFLLPFDVRWELHLGAFGAVLAVGLVAYRFGALGAGDVKLISALALWTGFAHLPGLLLSIALTGGALALILLVARMLLLSAASYYPPLEPVLRAAPLRSGAKLPYGVAIAVGGVATGLTLPQLGLFIANGLSILPGWMVL